jgi:hypothetical protein
MYMGQKFDPVISFIPYRSTTVPNWSAAQTDLGYFLTDPSSNEIKRQAMYVRMT